MQEARARSSIAASADQQPKIGDRTIKKGGATQSVQKQRHLFFQRRHDGLIAQQREHLGYWK